jgi:hypothetical protein
MQFTQRPQKEECKGRKGFSLRVNFVGFAQNALRQYSSKIERSIYHRQGTSSNQSYIDD